jgi:hypothetical protein
LPTSRLFFSQNQGNSHFDWSKTRNRGVQLFTVNKENPTVLPNFLKKGLAQQRTMLIPRKKGRVELRFIVQLSVGCCKKINFLKYDFINFSNKMV